MKEILIKIKYPECDEVALQEFKEVAQEYFAANIMDGDTSRIDVSVVDVTGVYSTIERLKRAREDEKCRLIFSQLSEANMKGYQKAVETRKRLEDMAKGITPDNDLLEEIFKVLSKF